MSRIALVFLAVTITGGGVSAGTEEARLLLDDAHEEVLLTYRDEANAPDHWRASLAHTERAYELLRGESSELQALAQLAERAFHAEERLKAERYARRALTLAVESEGRSVFSIGNAIHHANLVLGKLALVDGDLAGAREYLLDAGRTPGSPQLDTFGPNMMLAEQLLERGERAVVLEYLELCRRFWRGGIERGTLDSWSRIVESGGTPDFGANTRYGL